MLLWEIGWLSVVLVPYVYLGWTDNFPFEDLAGRNCSIVQL